MWHPALIARMGTAPRWSPAQTIPVDQPESLLLLPSAAADQLETPLRERLQLDGGTLLEGPPTDRRGWLTRISQALQLESPLAEAAPTSADGDQAGLPPVEDFFALGYGYLQVGLLIQQLRYYSPPEQPPLAESLVQSAQAWMTRDVERCQQLLQAAFDQLSQERDQFFSQPAYLIDVTLCPPSDAAAATPESCDETRAEWPTVLNLQATAGQLEQLRQRDAARWASLVQRLDQAKTVLIGGLSGEQATPLLTAAGVHRALERGRHAYARLGLRPPRVFGRLTYGFSPSSPAQLTAHRFLGAVLYPWLGGSYPKGQQAKVAWEGPDGSTLEMLQRYVLDANNAADLLRLGKELGEQLDHHQVPTVILGHWPGQVSWVMEDLARLAARSPAVGSWTGVETYFESTQRPYHQDRLGADGFQFDWLAQCRSRPGGLPILSQISGYGRLTLRLDELIGLRCLLEQLDQWLRPGGGETRPAVAADGDSQGDFQGDSQGDTSSEAALVPAPPAVAELPSDLVQVAERVDALAGELAVDQWLLEVDPQRLQELSDRLGELSRDAAARLAAVLPRMRGPAASERAAGRSPRSSDQLQSRLVINPLSGPRRVYLEGLPGRVVTGEDRRVYAAGEGPRGGEAVIDVPGMGVVRIDLEPLSGRSARAARSRGSGVLATADGTLSNEFLQLQLDPKTGQLRTLMAPGHRGNRLGQQLAWRGEDAASGEPTYFPASCQGLELVEVTDLKGVIRSRGRIFGEQGAHLADFQSTFTLWRGSRVVLVEHLLTPRAAWPSRQPHRHYACLRTAWATPAASLACWSHSAKLPWPGGGVLAPWGIEIDEVDYRTFLLCDGLFYHRRRGERFLDSWLAWDSAQPLQVRLGIGVDLPQPHQAISELACPPTVIEDPHPELTVGASGWFFHCNQPQTSCVPVAPLRAADSPQLIGVRFLVLETGGRASAVQLRSFRDLARGSRVTADGQHLGNLRVSGDRLELNLRAHEQMFVDLFWQS
jgi:hypothetical protein